MKRRKKPDVMTVLVLLIALGVIATGMVQGAMRDANLPAVAMAAQK